MGGQEGHRVPSRTVKKRKLEGKSGNGSKSIIRLANDLHACTGYKGNHLKRTRDRLANATTGVKRITQGGGCG